MKEEHAVVHLRALLLAYQKFRSNVREEMDLPERMLAEMYPWIFGKHCPIPQLTSILDRYERDGHLAPIDYYNQLVIVNRSAREVLLHANMLCIDADVPLIPDPPSSRLAVSLEKNNGQG